MTTDSAGAVTTEGLAAETLPPSPVESSGCEPHGDHWDCEGPASTITDAPSAAASTAAEESPSVAIQTDNGAGFNAPLREQLVVPVVIGLMACLA